MHLGDTKLPVLWIIHSEITYSSSLRRSVYIVLAIMKEKTITIFHVSPLKILYILLFE